MLLRKLEYVYKGLAYILFRPRLDHEHVEFRPIHENGEVENILTQKLQQLPRFLVRPTFEQQIGIEAHCNPQQGNNSIHHDINFNQLQL